MTGLHHVVHIRTDVARHFCQNADNLSPLLSLQFAHPVVGFHHLHRLYKHGLSRGRLVMHNALDPFFQRRSHRYHQSPVAHGWGHILIHQALTLSGPQYII